VRSWWGLDPALPLSVSCPAICKDVTARGLGLDPARLPSPAHSATFQDSPYLPALSDDSDGRSWNSERSAGVSKPG
jgi:hypothetical protein